MHHHFSICNEDENQSFNNYLILVEIIDSVPLQPYIITPYTNNASKQNILIPHF